MSNTNWLDNAISWFFPKAGLRRAAWRALAAYEGAETGRRANSWRASGASANAEIGGGVAKLRERSRELLRNNHFAANAAEKWVTRIIGAGVTTIFDDQATQDLWDSWSAICSADGLPHWAYVQKMVARSVFESGECLVRFRMRDRADGIRPPFQVQIIEPDYLDLSKTQQIQGGYIIQGVQFNMLGKREGYWLFGQHPGDIVQTGVRGGSLQSAFVSAVQVLHVYEPTRPGQVRGVPRLAPVLAVLREIDDWEDAELVAKRISGCLAGVVTSPDGPRFGLGAQTTEANTNQILEEFRPGMIAKLMPGEEIEFNTPQYGGGYADYKASRQRDASAGMAMPYELTTGDYSRSNYSSSRMGAVAFGETVVEQQWNVYIPQLCMPVVAEFQRLAWMFENVGGKAKVEFTPSPYRLLDRQAEGKADQLELQTGALSWDEYLAALGRDPRKQIKLIADRKVELEEAGVNFFGVQPKGTSDEGQMKEEDSDGRKTQPSKTV